MYLCGAEAAIGILLFLQPEQNLSTFVDLFDSVQGQKAVCTDLNVAGARRMVVAVWLGGFHRVRFFLLPPGGALLCAHRITMIKLNCLNATAAQTTQKTHQILSHNYA